MFVDAGLPGGGTPLDSPFGDHLRSLYASGERFPNWSEAALAPVVPDPQLRQRLVAELHPQPFKFWTEAPPVFDGWPDAPCAYLHFSAPYVDAATDAARRRWPVETLEAGHFNMLVDPAAVADALQRLLAATLGP